MPNEATSMKVPGHLKLQRTVTFSENTFRDGIGAGLDRRFSLSNLFPASKSPISPTPSFSSLSSAGSRSSFSNLWGTVKEKVKSVGVAEKEYEEDFAIMRYGANVNGGM